jgi:Uma2 family endonuclease
MSALTVERLYTPEDLLTLPDGERYELVDGRLVEKQMGAYASGVAVRLTYQLQHWNTRHRSGHLYDSECGYQCFPDNALKVRKPDISFVRRDRLPGGRTPQGHFRIPPDLAVEVVSPNELHWEVEQKVHEYLAAGVPLVWVVEPELRTVQVIRQDGSATRLRADDTLTGGDVLPGFECRVGELFEEAPDEPSAG